MIFKLYWAWYDDSWSVLFSADKSEEQWRADCVSALKYSLDDYLKQEEYMPSVVRWFEFSIPAIVSLGYDLIKPQSFGFEGCDIVDEKIMTAEDQKVLKGLFGEDCYSKLKVEFITKFQGDSNGKPDETV